LPTRWRRPSQIPSNKADIQLKRRRPLAPLVIEAKVCQIKKMLVAMA
jgi:hypothetical protein